MAFSCVDAHPEDPARRLFHPVPLTAVLDDIVQDPSQASAAEAGLPPDPCAEAASPFLLALCPPRGTAEAGLAPAADTLLLLSGGGPWGAFGAGFLNELHRTGRYRVPRLITGVSTGGLQTLLLAGHSSTADRQFAALVAAYRPARESEIVDRGWLPMTVVTGSMAGTRPLRKRIERGLCTDGKPERGCPAIDAIARSADEGRRAYIGFVYADTGEFVAADVVNMAQLATEGPDPAAVAGRARALGCLTGAAMASSAVPVQLQQVRINGRTALDGGVRLSVFEARAIADATAVAVASARPAPVVHVVRNGPTVVADARPQPGLNERLDALEMAQAAQAIIVNQVEVASIALVRLGAPDIELRLMTADRKGANTGCARPEDGSMFQPAFMQCLQDHGAWRANLAHDPWQTIRVVGSTPAPPPAPRR